MYIELLKGHKSLLVQFPSLGIILFFTDFTPFKTEFIADILSLHVFQLQPHVFNVELATSEVHGFHNVCIQRKQVAPSPALSILEGRRSQHTDRPTARGATEPCC